MTDEILAAWISGGCTIAATIIAFGTLAVQASLNRRADRQARKQAFNEGLYQDGIAAARALSNAAGSFRTQLHVARHAIGVASETYKATGELRPPSVKFPEILALNRSFGEAVSDLVFLIEERRICDQRLEIFKLAILAKAHEVHEAFDIRLIWNLLQGLQHELPDGSLSTYMPLRDKQLENLDQSIRAIDEPLQDCIGFCEDLIVELQNAHLGDLFKAKLVHRVPLDPSRVVLRLDDHEKLMAWIATTPWERNNRRIEAEFKAKLVGSSPGEIAE